MGTAIVPVAMAQMRDSMPRHRIASSLAVLSATLGVGGGIGIPLGGAIISAGSWAWLFWVSAALSVIALVLVALVLPRERTVDRGGYDLTGTVLMSVGLLALLVALSQGGTWGWVSGATLLSAAAGVLVLAAWAVVELRHPHPLVDLRTSTSPALLATNTASLLLGVMMFSNLLLTTLQLQGPPAEGGFGWSARDAGLAMLPNALGMLAVAPVSARLADRFGPHTVLAVGAAIGLLGNLLRIVATPTSLLAVVWTTVVGIGVGIGYAALPMLVARFAPGPQIGEANGVNALVRAIGTAVASAAVAAVASTLSSRVGGQVVPSAAALTAVSAGGAVLGALVALCALPTRHGTDHSSEESR